jgi:hypothetical protein
MLQEVLRRRNGRVWKKIINEMMKKKILVLAFAALSLTSCHRTNLEDLAVKSAEDYTERYCPTPFVDSQRTDSVGFDRASHTFSYYYTISGKIDDPEVFSKGQKQIVGSILKGLKENTSMKEFKQAAYNFRYVFRSQKSGNVLMDKTFTIKNYK